MNLGMVLFLKRLIESGVREADWFVLMLFLARHMTCTTFYYYYDYED